jgi:hypothetical protein
MASRTERRRSARRAPRPRRASTDDPAIDALYGLEPPIGADAPGGAEPAALQAVELQCPYCGEPFHTLIDLSAGSSAYIEDCQVCCQPVELELQVDADGALERLSAMRGD